MNDTQSLANQLGWSITTQDYLNDLNNSLRQVEKHYEDGVEQLQHNNYFAELLDEVKKMHYEFAQLSNDLIHHVETEHLAYIDTQSKAIQTALTGIVGQ
jgi:hypothetical protein